MKRSSSGKMSRNKKPVSANYDRKAAMVSRPEQLPFVRREEREKGGCEITVEIPRAGWLRWVAGKGMVERSFGIDQLGLEIYEACNGQTNVKKIIERFAKTHHLNFGEAEQAVTTYLKILTSRNLIGIAIDRKKLRK